MSNEYGIGYTFNYDESGINFFYFDLTDYQKIKDYHWYFRNGYIISSNKILLHRLIMSCPEDKIIDHINHKKYDNRKDNLRIVTYQQNAMNMGKKNNKTGYTGVYYDTRRGKYRSEITYKMVKYWLGDFDNLEDAIVARKEAEEKYFGEYSYANSVDDSKEEGTD